MVLIQEVSLALAETHIKKAKKKKMKKLLIIYNGSLASKNEFDFDWAEKMDVE